MTVAAQKLPTKDRVVYERVLALLADNGWKPAPSYLSDYTSYNRGEETLNLRWGYYPSGMRPTWAEIIRPRLVGERIGVPDYWTGRMPDWATIPLPRKGLLEALTAAITAGPCTGPFQRDDGYWDDAK